MFDEFGNWYTPPASGEIDWGQLFSEWGQVAGRVFDPRRGYNIPPNQYGSGAGYPPAYDRCNGIQVGASTLGGGGGFCISPLMMVAAGLLVGAFFFGQKRGRG